MYRQVRRVITTEDSDGKSFVLSDGPAPLSQEQAPGLNLTDVWMTSEMPVRLPIVADPTATGPLRLVAKPNGVTFRFCEFPPDKDYLPTTTAHRMFDAIGGAANLENFSLADDEQRHQNIVAAYLRDPAQNVHPTMHRTETLDYAVVLSGQIVLVLDKEERLLGAGDCVIQGGANHAWSNRTEESCLIVFIVIDGKRE